MKKLLTKVFLSLTLSALLISTSIFVLPKAETYAASDLTYYLQTSHTGAVSPDEEFDVEVYLKSQTTNKIVTAGFGIVYNPNFLEVTSSSITASTDFPQIVDNEASNGSVKFTGGNSNFININSSTPILIATIPFRVKSTTTSDITSLEFVNDSSTTVIADDGETELLNSIEALDIVISKIEVQITPATKDFSQGDEQEFSLAIYNPEEKDIITAEVKIPYDESIFESVSDKMDITETDFDFVIDQDVKNGYVLFSAGVKGTEPANTTSINIGKFTLKIKDNAPDISANLSFDKTNTNIYMKNDPTHNMLSKYVDGSYQIGTGGSENDTTAPTVTVNPTGGTLTTTTNITLAADEPATIYFSTNNAEAKENFLEYQNPISISTTTDLRYYAKDNANNESQMVTQSYVFGSQYELTLISTKDNANPGETVTLTATLNDSDGNPLSGKQITFQSTQGTLSSTNQTTNTNGKVEVQLTVENSDTSLTASLSDDNTITKTLTISVDSNAISSVTIITDQIDNSTNSTVNITVQNAGGNPVASTSVTLTTTGKTYTGTTNTNGIAEITIPANDLSSATYTFTASAGGINSTEKSIVVTGSTNSNSSTGTESRPGGGYTPSSTPSSGPEHIILLFLALSGFLVWKLEKKFN